MKKLFTLLAIGLLAAGHIKAQSEVMLKMKYMPGHTYHMVSNSNINMEMNFEGDSAMIKKIKATGQSLPIIMAVKSSAEVLVKTGEMSPQKDYKLTMTTMSPSSKMTINGVETPVPSTKSSQIFHCRYASDGKLMIDSVSGQKLTDSMKVAIVKLFNGVMANIKFPDKPMKIGDTFVQDAPMMLPILGAEMKIISKTKYKLTDIKSDQAFFDVNMEMTMDMTGNKMELNMSGDGNGTLIYSISGSFPSLIHNDINMIYSVDMPQAQNMKMNGKMKMTQDIKNTTEVN